MIRVLTQSSNRIVEVSSIEEIKTESNNYQLVGITTDTEEKVVLGEFKRSTDSWSVIHYIVMLFNSSPHKIVCIPEDDVEIMHELRRPVF